MPFRGYSLGDEGFRILPDISTCFLSAFQLFSFSFPTVFFQLSQLYDWVISQSFWLSPCCRQPGSLPQC